MTQELGQKTQKGKPGPRKGAGGRPRRTPLSEKETLEKARGLGRRSMLAVMQGWVDDLSAVEIVRYQGVPVVYEGHVQLVANYPARAEARRQIADRCGFRHDPDEAPDDLGRLLLDALARMPSDGPKS